MQSASSTDSGSSPRIRGLVPILLLIALMMAGNGMVTPMLSLYAQQFGVGGTLIGMLFTLFGLGRIFANMPTGFLSERFGRRPFMWIGPAVLGVGSIGAALATEFDAILFWRFVQGFGSGIYMTVSATVLVELSRPGERGRLMAYYQGATLFGAGMGPAIGGLLTAQFGYAAPFWGYALVALAAMILALLTFEEPVRAAAPGAEDGPPPSLRGLLRQMPFILLCTINFGVFLTRTTSHWILLPLLATSVFGLSVDVIGMVLTIMTVINFIMLPIAGPLIDRIGPRGMTISSTLMTGLALTALAISSDLWVFWVAIVVLGVSAGFNGPAVAAAIADQIPPGLYGPAMGFQRVVGDVGIVTGPILIGLLYDLTSAGSAGGLLANALLMLAAGTLFGLGTRSSRAPKNIP